MKFNRKLKRGIIGKRGEMWYRMMVESVFVDVFGSLGFGVLVFIFFDEMF